MNDRNPTELPFPNHCLYMWDDSEPCGESYHTVVASTWANDDFGVLLLMASKAPYYRLVQWYPGEQLFSHDVIATGRNICSVIDTYSEYCGVGIGEPT